MYEAVKNIKKLTPKEHLIIKSENGFTANKKEQTLLQNILKLSFIKMLNHYQIYHQHL